MKKPKTKDFGAILMLSLCKCQEHEQQPPAKEASVRSMTIASLSCRPGCGRLREGDFVTSGGEKIEAIEAVTPPSLRRGQFTVPDRLITLRQGSSL